MYHILSYLHHRKVRAAMMYVCRTQAHMLPFKMHKEAFPLEGDLDDVAPAWDNRCRGSEQHTGPLTYTTPSSSNQRALRHHSPGEETGADHVAKHSDSTGGQAHQQWNVVGVLTNSEEVRVKVKKVNHRRNTR